MNKGYIAYMSNCGHLVHDIALKANLEILPFQISRFPSGEVIAKMNCGTQYQNHPGNEVIQDPWIPPRVPDDYNPDHLHILGNIHHPVNDNIMELLSMIDLAKNIGFRNISLIIPYMGYARQDRMERASSSIGLRILSDMINQAGIQNLITIDVHSVQILSRYLDCNLFNIAPWEILLHNNFPLGDYQIVCPDMGSSNRVIPEAKLPRIHGSRIKCGMTSREYGRASEECGMTIGGCGITIAKSRSASGISMNLEADLVGKKCLIIDDIIDSGATIRAAIAALKQRNASEISIYVTHLLNQPDIDAKIYRSNTICSKVSDGVLDVVSLVSKAISGN